jgi:hypothetical protein
MNSDFEDGLAEIIEKNAKADAKADSLLDKLKASKWTAIIVVGGAAIGLLIWGVSLLVVG